MSIFNFVTQDELDDLDEDPRMAFLGLVNHAQRSLSKQLATLNTEEERDWKTAQNLEQSFMNVIVASGKRFEIEPFLSTEVPQYADYRGSDYQQFRYDLDHYVTQLVLDNSLRSKKTSVTMLPETRDRIKSYVNGLRECIEKSNLHEQKKSDLLKRLDQFDKELEKRRLNIMEVTMLGFAILQIPGGMWASAEITQKLIVNINQVVAEAKATEDKTQQVVHAPPKALSPPRAPIQPRQPPSWEPKGSNLDDEIPF
jgi:hypothetical protein